MNIRRPRFTEVQGVIRSTASRTFKNFQEIPTVLQSSPREQKRSHGVPVCTRRRSSYYSGSLLPSGLWPQHLRGGRVFHGSGFSSTDRAQSVWLTQKSVFFPHGFLVFTAGPTFFFLFAAGSGPHHPDTTKFRMLKTWDHVMWVGPCQDRVPGMGAGVMGRPRGRHF